jgi:electron transfer flavoprotein beta subunit
VKQVPDTNEVKIDPVKGTLIRDGVPSILNHDDANALEEALKIKDRDPGTYITVITMGPPAAGDVLRECLFRGADRGILVTDRRAAASDTLATSYILSRAVKTVGNYDFVFCGRQAIDGDTAQVGPQLAEKLGIAQITYFESLTELTDRTVRIRRNVGNGWEILEARLPVLVTVIDLANTPRPCAARRTMRYKRARTPLEITMQLKSVNPQASEAEIEREVGRQIEALKMQGMALEQWNLDDIKADLNWCGLAGSPTKVHRVQSIVLTKEGYTEIPSDEQGVRQLIHELVVDRTLG